MMVGATLLLSLSLIGMETELNRRLRLKPGMVFRDGGVECEVTVDSEGKLRYRTFLLTFAARDVKEGVVIYSSYNTVQNGESAYGIVAYNTFHGVMMNPEGKKVSRVHKPKQTKRSNAILRRKK
jgi:hypothetical protein